MKYYRAELGGIDNWVWFNTGNLLDLHRQWTSQPDHWTLFFLEHSGVFIVNNRAYPFEDGFVAIAGPGAKVGFVNVGENTQHYRITFGLKKRVEVVALPTVSDTGEFKELRRQEFKHAEEWLTRSIGPALACTYNVLWQIAEPSEALRSSMALYDFEKLVNERLSEKITVQDLCQDLQVSQSHLLRMVRSEYGVTIQEYVREKRAEIAKTLIVSTDLPLKTIAAQTGMGDLQYFNKAVRQSYGMSPRSLRQLSVNRTKH